MMKLKLPTATLFVSLCCLPTLSFAALEVRDPRGWETLLQTRWFEWETRFKVFPRDAEVQIETSLPSATEWAHTVDSRIRLNPKLAGDRAESVLQHELAHAFLNHYCPSLKAQRLIHEAFAAYVSGDYHQIFFRRLSEPDFLFASKASERLLNSKPETLPPQILIEALGRVLLEKVDKSPDHGKSIESQFQEIFSTCDQASASNINERFTAALVGPSPELQSYPDEKGFLLIDGVSGLPLVEIGDVDGRLSPGSLLKSLVIASSVQVRRGRMSRLSDSWACEENESLPRRKRWWAWPEALVKSCNGFFLDAGEMKSTELQNYRKILQSVLPSDPQNPTQSHPSWTSHLTMAQAIGLLPGIELSPREVARLYKTLYAKHADVFAALKSTAKSGTLQRFPEAKWFDQSQIALKTGTVRDLHNRPMVGWIVAISPRSQSGAPAWIAVAYQRGRAPQELLGFVRQEVTRFLPMRAEAAQVQILGLLPPSQVKIRCSLRGEERSLAELKANEKWECADAFRITFPDAQGKKIERKYYGYLRLDHGLESVSLGRSPRPRQARARQGSSLILQTSMLNYSLQVLASEYPWGRQETLKGMALAAQANARGSRHLTRPVCDTTHCQVFAPQWNGLSQSARQNLLTAVLQTQGQSLVSWGDPALRWFPYSLAGEERWQVFLSRSEVAKRLVVSSLHQLQFEGTDWRVSPALGESQKWTCEEIRNRLKLPSCPDHLESHAEGYVFHGKGEGHFQGLRLKEVDSWASQGESYQELLRRFYPGLRARF